MLVYLLRTLAERGMCGKGMSSRQVQDQGHAAQYWLVGVAVLDTSRTAMCAHACRYQRPGGLSWLDCYMKISNTAPQDLKEAFLYVSARGASC